MCRQGGGLFFLGSSLAAALVSACQQAPALQEQQAPARLVDMVSIATPAGEGVHNILLTGDGGVLVLGTQENSVGDRDAAIWKRRADLSPDPAFGAGGMVSLGSSDDDQAADAVELFSPDGESEGFLVVAQVGAGDGAFAGLGYAGGADLALIRLRPGGQLDERFGTGGLVLLGGADDDELVVHLNNFSEPGRRILPGPDGTYYIAAQTRSTDGDFLHDDVVGVAASRDAIVLRVTDDGVLDPSFGAGGIVRVGTSPHLDPQEREPNDFFFALASEPDGGIAASGYALGRKLELPGGDLLAPGNMVRNTERTCDVAKYCYLMDGLLVRLDAAGALVSDWGKRGVVLFGGSYQEKQYDVIRDTKGRHLFVGRTSSYDGDLARPAGEGGRFDAYIVRVTPDGETDTSFGTGGSVVFGGSGDDKAHRILEYAPGRYAMAVETDSPDLPFAPVPEAGSDAKDIVIYFLAEDGSLEEALRVGTPGGDKPLGFALLPSGRLMLAGVAEVDGQFEANPQSDLDVFLALVDPPVRADETGE